MPKKILIIGRSHHPDGKETADEIYQSLSKLDKLRDYEPLLSHYNDLLFDINSESVKVIDTKTGLDLSSVNAVLMTNWFSHASVRKDIAHSLALFFQDKQIPFFNTEALHNRSTSKLSQMVLASQNDVAVPRTIFCLSFDKLVQYVADNLSLPYIYKDAQGSRGQSNHLISNNQEAAALGDTHTESHPYLVQEYIDSGMVDYRIFVTGTKSRLVIKRIGSGDSHITNTSAGAATEIMEPQALGDQAIDMVNAMVRLLHREVTGVDIMFDKNSNKPYFLEANPIPQIATGSNVELKLNALAEALSEAANSKEV